MTRRGSNRALLLTLILLTVQHRRIWRTVFPTAGRKGSVSLVDARFPPNAPEVHWPGTIKQRRCHVMFRLETLRMGVLFVVEAALWR
jgi:hypothetical protein